MRNEELMNKWKPILEHTALPGIQDSHRAAVTATLLENTETAMIEEGGYSPTSLLEAAPANSSADMAKYDPVLISLVRRAMPNLVAYDIAGVQPMTGPTGLIFAMRTKYEDTGGKPEAFYTESDSDYSGAGTHANALGAGSETTGTGLATATAGTFNLDVDANGRWSVEKFKGLMFQIEKEANQIAKDTRRGKGNLIVCSSDVASALQMAGVLDYAPALNSNNLSPDDTGNTFAGVLNGRFKVYIDPYAGANYMVVGYKGSSTFDAGLFYCPYVPLQMVRAVGENSFQSKLGFKTRYGMVANPFAGGSTVRSGVITANDNVYYRRTAVTNLL